MVGAGDSGLSGEVGLLSLSESVGWSGLSASVRRPGLSGEMSVEEFRNYYFLKEELVRFCRETGLSTGGSKAELTERVARFLDGLPGDKGVSEWSSGRRASQDEVLRRRVANRDETLSEESVIEEGFVCSERHRAFFREKIGAGFRFIVPFQRWLKANAGRTYGEAIEAYREIVRARAEGGSGSTEIGKQFEYNRYVRDFFADNRGRYGLKEAIICWKYKRDLPGHNRYEGADLKVLER